MKWMLGYYTLPLGCALFSVHHICRALLAANDDELIREIDLDMISKVIILPRSYQ